VRSSSWLTHSKDGVDAMASTDLHYGLLPDPSELGAQSVEGTADAESDDETRNLIVRRLRCFRIVEPAEESERQVEGLLESDAGGADVPQKDSSEASISTLSRTTPTTR
jgi:hypothetical protein